MTKTCPTMGPDCRGCPDCQGIGPGAGIYESNAHADSAVALEYAYRQNFQADATLLMIEACGDDPTDFRERRDRFGEEAIEVLQAGGMSAEELHALVDYVMARPKGEIRIEIGQALFTLAVLASFSGTSLMDMFRLALETMRAPAMLAKFRRKRADRKGRGTLPGRDTLTQES